MNDRRPPGDSVRLPSPLFENAVDSLDLALHFLLESDRHTAHKHAVLSSFHAVELLLKERLHREHPLLVFAKSGGTVSDDARTVGVGEAYARLRNAGVGLDSEDWTALVLLQRHRNRIQHRHFDPDSSYAATTRKALGFALRFARDSLGEDLEQWLGTEVYEAATGEILTHRELVEDASIRVERLDGEVEVTTCPSCGEETLVLDTAVSATNARCFFCLGEFDVETCAHCDRQVESKDFNVDWGACVDCANLMSEREHHPTGFDQY